MTAGVSRPPRRSPCQSDPERWFDHSDRAHALYGCLACPLRSWCAHEALAQQPSFGMWAGVWVEDNFADIAHHFAAIAQTTPPPAAVSLADAAPANPSVAALITARSSGSCEIMAPDCLLSVHAIASRIRARLWFELPDPAAGYAVCRRCHKVVQDMDRRLLRRFGYVIDRRDDPACVPFLWRQTRWMQLDSTGGALACSPRELSA